MAQAAEYRAAQSSCTSASANVHHLAGTLPLQGNVVSGEGQPEATAFYIHAAIHKGHPAGLLSRHLSIIDCL